MSHEVCVSLFALKVVVAGTTAVRNYSHSPHLLYKQDPRNKHSRHYHCTVS